MHHLRHYALDSKRRRDELFSASVPKSEAMALTFQHKIQTIARFVFRQRIAVHGLLVI